jgi:hypothetical protein
LISYIDRDKSFGEEAALRWAISKFGRNEASSQPQE